MIFPKPIVGKILRGEVTMTYRIAGGSRPRPGERIYVKAKQSDPIACHVIVTDVADCYLGNVTFDDARAMGSRTTDDFKAYWVQSYDKEWVERQAEVSDTDLRVRFAQRHARREVFAITFALDHSEHPRLLADRNARADYVESPAMALSHEPEAIDERTQEKFSREGHQGFVARERAREMDRELLAAEDRMRLVRFEARAKGVDVEDQVRWIESRIKQMERKVHKRKAA